MFTVVSHVHQKHKFNWEGLEGTSGGIYAAVYKLLWKDWLVISRNHNVDYYFFFFFTLHSELEKELSLHYTLLFGKFKDGCVYASYKSEWSIGAMDLYHHARYF